MPSPVAGTKHDQRNNMSPAECLAMRLCNQSGWSVGELAMTFQLVSKNVYPHINGECCHRYETVDVPIQASDTMDEPVTDGGRDVGVTERSVMIGHFILKEAIHSTAMEHQKGCDCVTCKAADGDEEALAEFYNQL